MTAHRTLAERSRAALVQRFPDLAPVLAAPPTVEAIVKDGVTIDLANGGRRFYDGDGRGLAEAQVAAFLVRPTRLLQGFPQPTPERAVDGRLLESLLTTCQHLGLNRSGFLSAPPADHGLLIVLGIGIGHHLPLLIERTAARRLVIVETEGEFLSQSTGAIDWLMLFEGVEGRGGSVDLFLTRSPASVVATLARTFTDDGAPLLDGTTLYSAYDNPILSEIRERLIAAARLAGAAPRSWENEHAHLSAAIGNLSETPFRLLTPHPRPKRPEPAIILGAGASLEAGIEHVKRLRHGAVVFSCGAALRTCRDHGLTPDFHCENDSAARLEIDGLERTITLIAPVTIDPAIPSGFEDRYFAFRDGETASHLLAKPDLTLGSADPTSVNLGVAAATAFGFHAFYLFGVDCGARFSGPRFSEAIPGNFGGTIATDARLNQSCRQLGTLIADRGLTVYNCSNGALIDGARPRHGTDVTFAIPRIDHSVVRAAIANAHAPWPPGTFLRGLCLASVRTATDSMFEAVIATLDATLATDSADDDLLALWRQLSALLNSATSDTQSLSTPTLGVIRTLVRHTTFFLNRTEATEAKRHIRRQALAALRALLPEMRDHTLRTLDEIQSRIPAGT